jgi:Carbamoyl-phosphate synthetase large chain, oligomerisation domain
MKSVGEAMAIGRTFKESMQKALRSLEIGSYGFDEKVASCELRLASSQEVREKLGDRLRIPNAERIWYVADALRLGMSVDELYQITKIDPWFLENILQIVQFEKELRSEASSLQSSVLSPQSLDRLRAAKQMGFSDVRLAQLLGWSEDQVRETREQLGILPVYKTLIPVPLNLLLIHRISIPHTKGKMRLSRPRVERLLFLAADQTASAKGSSSTTVVYMPPSHSRTMASKPSWSTVTRRP